MGYQGSIAPVIVIAIVNDISIDWLYSLTRTKRQYFTCDDSSCCKKHQSGGWKLTQEIKQEITQFFLPRSLVQYISRTTYFVRDSQSFLFSKQNLLPRLNREEINAKLIFASQYNSPANLILMQSVTWNPQKLRPQYSKLYTG